MERRQLPALCGAGLGGLSGCTIEQRNRPTATPRAESDRLTDTPKTASNTLGKRTTATGSTASTDPAVGVDALQPAVVEIDVDFLKLVYRGQFLYLNLTMESEPGPTLEELSFRFDGDAFGAIPPSQRSLYRAMIEKYQNEPANGHSAGWVLFELPESGDASDARLVWPGGEWRPGEQLGARLAAQHPLLTLQEWNVAEAVPNRRARRSSSPSETKGTTSVGSLGGST